MMNIYIFFYKIFVDSNNNQETEICGKQILKVFFSFAVYYKAIAQKVEVVNYFQIFLLLRQIAHIAQQYRYYVYVEIMHYVTLYT